MTHGGGGGRWGGGVRPATTIGQHQGRIQGPRRVRKGAWLVPEPRAAGGWPAGGRGGVMGRGVMARASAPPAGTAARGLHARRAVHRQKALGAAMGQPANRPPTQPASHGQSPLCVSAFRDRPTLGGSKKVKNESVGTCSTTNACFFSPCAGGLQAGGRGSGRGRVGAGPGVGRVWGWGVGGATVGRRSLRPPPPRETHSP